MISQLELLERAIAVAETMGDSFFFISLNDEGDTILDLYSTRDAGLAVLNWRQAKSPELFFGRLMYEGLPMWAQLSPLIRNEKRIIMAAVSRGLQH